MPLSQNAACALCQKEAEIRDSHVIPKFAYRRLRTPGSDGGDPIIIAKGSAISTSKQYREYMLCDRCEGIFQKWESAFAELTRTDGTDVLLSVQTQNGRQAIDERDSFVSLRSMDTQPLARFCLSILWRAHVARCVPWYSIGPYGELLRDILFNAREIPRSIVVCAVFYEEALLEDPSLAASFQLPFQRRATTFRWNYLLISGVLFMVAMGRSLPSDVSDKCIVNSQLQPIMISPLSELQRFIRNKSAGSVAKGKLGRRSTT